jgi:hypothetical protein
MGLGLPLPGPVIIFFWNNASEKHKFNEENFITDDHEESHSNDSFVIAMDKCIKLGRSLEE